MAHDDIAIPGVQIRDMINDHSMFVTFVATTLRSGQDRMHRIEETLDETKECVKAIKEKGCDRSGEHDALKSEVEKNRKLAQANAELISGVKGPTRAAYVKAGAVGGGGVGAAWLLNEFLPTIWQWAKGLFNHSGA